MSDEIQLRRKLKDSFGKDGDLILAPAMSKLLQQTSLKNLHHVVEDSFLPEICSLKESFNSQWLSDFQHLLLAILSLQVHGYELIFEAHVAREKQLKVKLTNIKIFI